MRNKDAELIQKEEIVERMRELKYHEVFNNFLDSLNFEYDDILDGKEVNCEDDLYNLSLEKLRRLEEEYISYIGDQGIDNEDEYDDEY